MRYPRVWTLVLIQQTFVEHLLSAWHCAGKCGVRGINMNNEYCENLGTVDA